MSQSQLRKLSTTVSLDPTMIRDLRFDPERFQTASTKPPPIKLPRTCEECYRDYVDSQWCFSCEKGRLPRAWASGNPKIDEFLRDIQAKSTNPQTYLQWVRYSDFADVRGMGRCGKKALYSALWMEGPIALRKPSWVEKGDSRVILKESECQGEENLDEFLNEVRMHWQFGGKLETRVLRCYGISRNPSNNSYVMVMEYFADGDIGHCLQQFYSQLSWEHKISILEDIARGLSEVHENGYVLRDFHGGNILINSLEGRAVIADMTICFPGNAYHGHQITGVLPYTAPELLNRKSFTKPANIYSFSIIMWELSTGERPFSEVPYDSLAVEIYRGQRPKVSENTPECFANLMRRCWHAEPYKRPTAKEVVTTLGKWGKKLWGLMFINITSPIYNTGDDQEIDDFRATIYAQGGGQYAMSNIVGNSEAMYVTQSFDYPHLDNVVESEEESEAFPTTFGQVWNENESDDEHSKQRPTLKRSDTLQKLKRTSEQYAMAQFARQLEATNFRFNQDWTSGCKLIDDFIRDTQENAFDYTSFHEWIPYEKFFVSGQLGCGGFSTVYLATWPEGPTPLKETDLEPLIHHKVALKHLDNSMNITPELIDEIKAHYQCAKVSGTSLVRCFGLSQDPETRNYVIVYDYMSDGDLGKCLTTQYLGSWWDKLQILNCITNGLRAIHKKGYVHRDLHLGNILLNGTVAMIADMGLSRPASGFDTDEVYGVLPFVAPEILSGKPYTPESDIYSFSMIMWSLSAGERPYKDREYDEKLASEICSGRRPEIKDGTPACYVALMKKCWDHDPKKRPDSRQLKKTFYLWEENMRIHETYGPTADTEYVGDDVEKMKRQLNQFLSSDGRIRKVRPSSPGVPGRVYTSKRLDFVGVKRDKSPVARTEPESSRSVNLRPTAANQSLKKELGVNFERRSGHASTKYELESLSKEMEDFERSQRIEPTVVASILKDKGKQVLRNGDYEQDDYFSSLGHQTVTPTAPFNPNYLNCDTRRPARPLTTTPAISPGGQDEQTNFMSIINDTVKKGSFDQFFSTEPKKERQMPRLPGRDYKNPMSNSGFESIAGKSDEGYYTSPAKIDLQSSPEITDRSPTQFGEGQSRSTQQNRLDFTRTLSNVLNVHGSAATLEYNRKRMFGTCHTCSRPNTDIGFCQDCRLADDIKLFEDSDDEYENDADDELEV